MTRHRKIDAAKIQELSRVPVGTVLLLRGRRYECHTYDRRGAWLALDVTSGKLVRLTASAVDQSVRLATPTTPQE